MISSSLEPHSFLPPFLLAELLNTICKSRDIFWVTVPGGILVPSYSWPHWVPQLLSKAFIFTSHLVIRETEAQKDEVNPQVHRDHRPMENKSPGRSDSSPLWHSQILVACLFHARCSRRSQNHSHHTHSRPEGGFGADNQRRGICLHNHQHIALQTLSPLLHSETQGRSLRRQGKVSLDTVSFDLKFRTWFKVSEQSKIQKI